MDVQIEKAWVHRCSTAATTSSPQYPATTSCHTACVAALLRVQRSSAEEIDACFVCVEQDHSHLLVPILCQVGGSIYLVVLERP